MKVPGFTLFRCEKCGELVYLKSDQGLHPDVEPWVYSEFRPLCPFHPGMTYYLHDGPGVGDE